MICLLLDYDNRTGVAEALPAMYVDFMDRNPGPFRFKIYSDPKKYQPIPGNYYSIFPRDFSINRQFVRGELDYKAN